MAKQKTLIKIRQEFEVEMDLDGPVDKVAFMRAAASLIHSYRLKMTAALREVAGTQKLWIPECGTQVLKSDYADEDDHELG